MWKTTLPAYIVSFIAFVVMGLSYQNGEINAETVAVFTDTIHANFKVSPVLLLPMIVLLILNLIKFPAIPGMAIGSLLGVILAVTVQGIPLAEVIAGLNYGYVQSTGVEVVDKLLCRGGIQNMMYTFSLSCIAISFGGVMEHVGYLRKIVAVVISRVKKDALLVPIVIASTTLGTLTMGEVYLSIVVNGNLYKETFKERGFRPECCRGFGGRRHIDAVLYSMVYIRRIYSCNVRGRSRRILEIRGTELYQSIVVNWTGSIWNRNFACM